MDSLLRPRPTVLLALALSLSCPAVASADHDGGVVPQNDSSQMSWQVALNSTVENHENTSATVETGERLDCRGRGYRHTVWYYFDIASRGRVVVTVTGSSLLPTAGAFDSVISLQGSQTGIGEPPIDCNDDGVSVGGSRIIADLSPGRYYVQVGGYDPDPSTTADVDIGRYSIEIQYTENLDRDGDGSVRPSDCDDDNPARKPGLPDIGVNGIDDDCDQVIDPDKDSDGYRGDRNDCNDTPGLGAPINPGAREIRGNTVDEDCDRKKSPFRRIGADVDYGADRYSWGILVTTPLRLEGVPGGAQSTVLCFKPNGRPCGRFGPTRKRTFPQLRGRRLPAKTVLIIYVSKRREIGRYIKITVRGGQRKPKKIVRCTNPGSSKPRKLGKCPGRR